MTKVLRGHHLLCVHGFQGLGYSPAFVEKMNEIVTDIRNDQLDFQIQVVAAFDEACMACPHRGIEKCEADQNSNEHVLSMDEKVIRHLGIEKEKVYQKSELISLTAEKVKPEDLDDICENCSWLSYGVCKEGMAKLREKYEK
ncbi:DUF1284 domain-containing protein [Bacillus aquiflavi]|uniref:DUF1284 domain-containing protein n=1 Tax=Bacillus aquiflavi TaxID=2672567 RepID=A0A6B3VVQ4_9BACI|nr:DUF1284 domain-containing protein [Bacillus aquiflavi]MBA4536715.1 DUF1284 domain-containing protein [Bacillus aquiflavi]NEY81082.1 DUF1284 domain-containing protein [Bacillus aquiflavi]UAC48748.1 DUF1284 domain-containing protein [Bacillus aquiflavi]